jgi:hypothetical protein
MQQLKKTVYTAMLLTALACLWAGCPLHIGEDDYPPYRYKKLEYRYLGLAIGGDHIEINYYLKKNLDLDNEAHRQMLSDLIFCLLENIHQVETSWPPRGLDTSRSTFRPTDYSTYRKSVYNYRSLHIYFHDRNANRMDYLRRPRYMSFAFRIEPDSSFVQVQIPGAGGHGYRGITFELTPSASTGNCAEVEAYHRGGY